MNQRPHFFEERSVRITIFHGQKLPKLQFCSIFTRFPPSSNISCQFVWCHRQAEKTNHNKLTGPPGRRVPWLRGMGRPRLRFSHLLRQYVPRRLKWSQEVGWKVGRFVARWWFHFLFSPRKLGKIPILSNIFFNWVETQPPPRWTCEDNYNGAMYSAARNPNLRLGHNEMGCTCDVCPTGVAFFRSKLQVLNKLVLAILPLWPEFEGVTHW